MQEIIEAIMTADWWKIAILMVLWMIYFEIKGIERNTRKDDDNKTNS